MTEAQVDELVAAVRALPSTDQVRVAKRIVEDLSEADQLLVLQRIDPSNSPAVVNAPSMLGLFADEPDLVDAVCRRAYTDRI